MYNLRNLFSNQFFSTIRTIVLFAIYEKWIFTFNTIAFYFHSKFLSVLSPVSPLYYKGTGQSPYPYNADYIIS